MTVDALIYARGGGRGHAARGGALAQVLSALGIRSQLIHRDTLEAAGILRRAAAHYLFVDTFAEGWRGELSRENLQRFPRRLLVSRYRDDSAGRAFTECYDTVLDPYPRGNSEWPAVPSRSLPVGYLIRNNPPSHCSAANLFTVYDPEKRCSAHLISVFQRLADRFRYQFALHHHFTETICGSKVLMVGAGYNTVYELIGTVQDIRFLPVRKRHDNQHHRCRMLKCGIESLVDLAAWLQQEPGSVDRQPYSTTTADDIRSVL